MFKIEAIQSFEVQKKYAKLCNCEAKIGYFAYAMFDVETNNPMGFAQFDIRGEIGLISDLREIGGNDDFEAMFILGRSTMNFIDLCGAHEAVADEDAGDERLMKAIGFNKNDEGNYYCNMTGMFTGGCGNH